MLVTPNTHKKQTSSSQTLGDQKRTRTGHTGHVMHNTDDIRQALIAQHEPPPTAVDGLHVYPLTPM